MAKYALYGQAAAGTNLTITQVIQPGSNMVRASVVELVVGCGATPADLAGIFKLMRTTTAGTTPTSTPTPNPVDPAMKASTCTGAVGSWSAEPTYTSNSELLGFGLHQRATFRWLAEPNGGLVIPATASNGIGFRSISNGGTAIITSTMFFEE